MKKLLELLRSARVKNGYSQEYLSVILGVSSSKISRWETGQTEMTLPQVELYASKVGLKISDLFLFLANSGKQEILPIAEIHVNVYTENAFKITTSTICELGMEHATMTSKKIQQWK